MCCCETTYRVVLCTRHGPGRLDPAQLREVFGNRFDIAMKESRLWDDGLMSSKIHVQYIDDMLRQLSPGFECLSSDTLPYGTKHKHWLHCPARRR